MMMIKVHRVAAGLLALLAPTLVTPSYALPVAYTLGFTKTFASSSIALNESTALTFRLTTDAGSGAPTGNISFTDELPSGLKIASPNGVTGISCSSGYSIGGTVTAVAGSDTISLAGLALGANSNCSFSVNVTGTALGLQSNSVMASAASGVSNTPTASASITVGSGVAVNTVSTSLSSGINSQLTVLDMSSGNGPEVALCMANWLFGATGLVTTYSGQTQEFAQQFKSGQITFILYVLSLSTTESVVNGIALSSDNSSEVALPCTLGSQVRYFWIKIISAIKRPKDLTDFADSSRVEIAESSKRVGPQAATVVATNLQMNGQGVLTATVGGNLYAVRPDYAVTAGLPTGKTSLAIGKDGLLRYTNSAGESQILYPAFLDTSSVQSALGAAWGGYLKIQMDGTGLFTRINGQQIHLAPDMALIPTSSAPGTGDLINDRANHYLVRVGFYYQGFTATPR